MSVEKQLVNRRARLAELEALVAALDEEKARLCDEIATLEGGGSGGNS